MRPLAERVGELWPLAERVGKLICLFVGYASLLVILLSSFSHFRVWMRNLLPVMSNLTNQTEDPMQKAMLNDCTELGQIPNLLPSEGYSELLEALETLNNHTCSKNAITRALQGRQSGLAVYVVNFPHLVLFYGALIFTLHTINPVRQYLKRRVPRLTGRAALASYAYIIVVFILLNTLTEIERSAETETHMDCILVPEFDIIDSGSPLNHAIYWVMANHGLQGTTATKGDIGRELWGNTDKRVQHVFECVRPKITISRVFTAVGLIGGTAGFVPSFVDWMDVHIFRLRSSEINNHKMVTLIVSLIAVAWEQGGSVANAMHQNIYMSVRYAHHVMKFLTQPFENLHVLLELATHPPSMTAEYFFRASTKSTSFDLLQLGILLRIFVYLATASLIQFGSPSLAAAPVSLPKFTEKAWEGEPEEGAVELKVYAPLLNL